MEQRRNFITANAYKINIDAIYKHRSEIWLLVFLWSFKSKRSKEALMEI